MTVAELDTSIELAIGDTNEHTWSQAQRIEKLNEAQDELVNLILGKAVFAPKVYELLTELQEIQSASADLALGFDLATTTDRDYLPNGLVNLHIFLGAASTWVKPKRISVQDFLKRDDMNRYRIYSNNNPVMYVWGNKMYVFADPAEVSMVYFIYYIGRAYTLGISASGSGKTRIVATPDINISLHSILIQMAKIKLLAMRAEEKDLAEIQIEQKSIKDNIDSLVQGALALPHDEAPKGGNFLRERVKEVNQ